MGTHAYTRTNNECSMRSKSFLAYSTAKCIYYIYKYKSIYIHKYIYIYRDAWTYLYANICLASWGQGGPRGGFGGFLMCWRSRRVSGCLGLSQKPRLWKGQALWIWRVFLRLQLRSARYGHRLVLLARLLLMATKLSSKSWSLLQYVLYHKAKTHA